MLKKKPFPTPDEFYTVWLPKRQARDDRHNHKHAKSIMRCLADSLRSGRRSSGLHYVNEQTRAIVEKQLATFGWKAEWSRYGDGVTLSWLDSKTPE